MKSIAKYLGSLTALIAVSAILVSCESNLPSDSAEDARQVPSIVFSPPESVNTLLHSRMIDQSVLFAEVTLRYEDNTDTKTVSRQDGTNNWPTNFRLPSGRDFSLEVTWYDTADGVRLDLVSFNRNFDAVFNSGPMNINYSDYDFDGYDIDNDGITNLAERDAGTSPIVADSVGCPIIPLAQSNVNDEPNQTYGNQVRFIDDFDLGLPRYSITTNRLGSPSDGLQFESPSAVRLSVSGASGQQDGSSNVKIVPTLSNDPDSIFVRMQVLPESTEVDSSDNSTDSRFSLFGRFFNSIAAGGVDDSQAHQQTGEVDLRIEVRNYQDGEISDFLQCAQVRTADGNHKYFMDVTEDGDNDGCARIDTLPGTLEAGREYLLGIGINREAQTIFFQIDDDRVEAPSSLSMYSSRNPFLSAGVSAFGDGTRSAVRVSEIRTNGVVDNQLTDLDPTIAARYTNLNEYLSDPSRSVSSENGRLKLEGTSDNENAVRTDLFIEGDTDYVAADLMLSSDTQVLSSDGYASVRITGAQYNDLSNGGVNGNEGDNWASLAIGVDGSGELRASACLIRSQTTNYESTCSVTETPVTVCPRFNLPVQYDTEYHASITLDRENRRLIYQLNDEQIIHEITTNMFLPAGGRKAANTRIREEGRVVGLVDNLSTIPPQ